MALDELLSYADLANRVEQALGVRPALSTLRAAAATDARSGVRTRLTAGMPGPVTSGPAGRALFRASEVQAWLAEHPRRRLRRQQERLRDAPHQSRPRAVAAARAAGLSWQQVADALAEADGTTYSRQWAQQRYRDT